MDTFKNPSIPISNLLIKQEFDSMTIPFKKVRYYLADEVDAFLSAMSSEAKTLENVTKKLLEYYEDTKNIQPTQKSMTEKVSEVSMSDDFIEDELSLSNALKQREARLERMQQHITEVLENAEKQAEKIIRDAEKEAEECVAAGKQRSIELISAAQLESDKFYRAGQSKIEEAKLIKTEIASQTAIIQADINSKAEELEQLASTMVNMSSKLRELNNGASA